MAKSEEFVGFTPSQIAEAQAYGQRLRENPQTVIPPLAGWGQRPQSDVRDSIISALMGFNKTMASVADASRLGDPVTAGLAGFAGAAGQPGPQAIAAERQSVMNKQMMDQLAAAPIEAISPGLVAAHPELKGLPLAAVHQIAPILKEFSAARDKELNPAERKAMIKIQKGEPLAEADLNGTRENVISAAVMARGAGQDMQKDELAYKHRERRSVERAKIVDKFNADTSVKRSQQAIDSANTIRALVDSNNPIAAAAVPTFMARASGEVGNLSEGDKKPFGGSQAIISRLKAAANQAASGTLTQENAQFVSQLADIMEKKANGNMDSLAKQRAKQYAAASDFLSDNDIFSTLRPESLRAAPVYKRTATNAAGKKLGLNSANGKWEPIN